LKSLRNGKLTGTFDDHCPPVREILSRVGDKWSVQVVVLLDDVALRFSALKRSIDGISQRMLTTQPSPRHREVTL
jgi:DNA-binding HxlR family transcriptional regulator